MSSSVNQFVKQGREFAEDTAEQARALGKQSIAAARDTTEQVMEAASDAADSVFRYTKKNPAKALLIAAASGALLLTIAKILTPSRD